MTVSGSFGDDVGSQGNEDIRAEDSMQQLVIPRDLQRTLLAGLARSFQEIQAILGMDNVRLMQVLAQLAAAHGYFVTLHGDFLQFKRPRFFCQVCHGWIDGDVGFTWYQCLQCHREVCMDCHEAMQAVGRSCCPHCDGTPVLMPLRCDGCHLVVINLRNGILPPGRCRNCGHRLRNASGPLEITEHQNVNPITSHRTIRNTTRGTIESHAVDTPSRASSRWSRQQPDFIVRPSSGGTVLQRPQKKTIVMLTRFESKEQFIRTVIAPYLKQRIKGLIPEKHVRKWDLRLMKAHPVVVARYDAWAEFFGAGRVIHQVNVSNAILAFPGTTEALPLSMKDIERMLEEGGDAMIKSLPVTATKIVAADSLPRYGLEREVHSRIRQRYRKEVRYRGANNREYTKICELKNSDIFLHERPRLMHVPTWTCRFQLGGYRESGKWHEMQFTETRTGLKKLSESWGRQNKYCEGGQHLVTSLKTCQACKKGTCPSCAVTMRTWGLTRWCCSEKCKQSFNARFQRASLPEKLRLTWLSNRMLLWYGLIGLLMMLALRLRT